MFLCIFLSAVLVKKCPRGSFTQHTWFFRWMSLPQNVITVTAFTRLPRTFLNICESFADDCDMRFNCTKSYALRIGPRFLCNCAALTLCGEPLIYATSVAYLGVYLTAAKSFKCLYDHIKLKFYRTFNALYSRNNLKHQILSLFVWAIQDRVTVFRSFYMLLSQQDHLYRKAVRMLNRCIGSAALLLWKY